MVSFGPNLFGSGCELFSGLCAYVNGGSGSINSSNMFKRVGNVSFWTGTVLHGVVSCLLVHKYR
jgi:hypothetical protein